MGPTILQKRVCSCSIPLLSQFGVEYRSKYEETIEWWQLKHSSIKSTHFKDVYIKGGTYNFEILRLYTSRYNSNTYKWIKTRGWKRITYANRAHYALLRLQKSQSVIRAEKLKIYKLLTRPEATYGAESWTLNKDIAKWLAAFERKVLKRMSGGIKVSENWRKRYNEELMQLFRDVDTLIC